MIPDEAVEAVADLLAYRQVKWSNPKADSAIWGYRTFSEDQREFLRGRHREEAREMLAASPAVLPELLAIAWDDGAATAWNRSTPEVNAHAYQWRTDGEPHNPYRK